MDQLASRGDEQEQKLAALERGWPSWQYPAWQFWKHLLAEGGHVLQMGKSAGFLMGRLDGEPVMHRFPDGSVFMVDGACDVAMPGGTWRVVMSRGHLAMERFRIRLSFPVASLVQAEHLLDIAVSVRMRIQRETDSAAAVAALYRRIRQLSPRVAFREDLREQPPTFQLTTDGELVPTEITMVATIEDGELLLEIRDFYKKRVVTLECDVEQQDMARELLACLETTPRVDDNVVQSTGREIDVSGYDWSRIGGCDGLRTDMEEWICAPLRNPELFRHLGVKPPTGILLAGPPGTGKTLIAKVLACEADAAFFYAAPSDLFSMWFGQSERIIAALFKSARKSARRRGRAIVFLDEIDGLFIARDDHQHEATRRVMAQVLTELDGLEELNGITILAATNRLEDIDAALLRPGRFDRILRIPRPDRAARRAILEVHLRGKPQASLDVDALATEMDGFVGADIQQVVVRAAFAAAREVSRHAVVELHDLAPEHLKTIRMSQEHLREAIAGLRAERESLGKG